MLILCCGSVEPDALTQVLHFYFFSGRGTPVEEWLWFDDAWHHSSYSLEGHKLLWTKSGKKATPQDCVALVAVSEIVGVVTRPNNVKLLGNQTSDNRWLSEYVTEIHMVIIVDGDTRSHKETFTIADQDQEMIQTHGSFLTNANYSFSQRSVQFLVQTCNVTRLLFSVVCYHCK